MTATLLSTRAATAEERAYTDYHAVMRTVDSSDPVPAATAQLRRWFDEKKLPLAVDTDAEHREPDRTARVRYREYDGRRDLRMVLHEHTPLGTWTSQMLATADGWVEVRVTNSLGEFVAVPRLAKYLMRELPLGDAGLRFSPTPQLWGPERVDELVTRLTDPDRSLAVFVAAIGEHEDIVGPFQTQTAKWMAQTYGLAQSVVLTCPAVRRLGEELRFHAVKPWTIRTYLPGLEPNVVEDSRRHRYLSTASLAHRGTDSLATMFGRIARAQVEYRRVPEAITTLHREFLRLEDAAALRAVEARLPSPVPRPVPPPEPELREEPDPPLAQPIPRRPPESAPARSVSPALSPIPDTDAAATLDLVRTVLGLEEITESALLEILEAATAPRVDPEALGSLEQRMTSLRDEISEKRTEIDFLRLLNQELDDDVSLAESESSAARHESLTLRRRLQAIGDPEQAWSPIELEERPSDLLELVRNRLPEGILFTGDEKDVQAVIERDTTDRCLNSAWEAVTAMADYLRALNDGSVNGSFHHYVQSTPAGYRGMSPKKSAENETRTTQRSWGKERMFKVPSTVSTTGWATMNAHVKLGQIGMAAPRLHYLHDAAGGQIIVGYIGLHLTNTKTN